MSQAVDPTANSPNIKLVLLGESTVGKTSIVNVVHGGEYIPEQTATIGACFHIKVMKVGNVVIKLHIWDTAGQERFRSLAPMYYRDAQFALLTYAIDNKDSFQTLETWYQGLVDDCITMPNVLIVGNKSDREEQRQISREEGQELANKLNAKFFEISAKEDHEGIKKMLDVIAQDAVAEYYYRGQPGEMSTTIPTNDNTPKKCKC